MIKTIALTLALLFPATMPVKPTTTEVGQPLLRVQVIKPLAAPSVKNFARLDYLPFHFDPMGTHPNSYTPANCTWGASSMEPAIPQSWGNAAEWADHARAAGITVSDTPIVGAVAQTSRGFFGHVAVVTKIDSAGIWITEMNFDEAGGVRTRLALPGEFVFIYV